MSDAPPIVNIADIPQDDFGHGEKFSAKLGRIGRTLGMQKIGCGLVVLEPGKRAWPHHGHYVQEELDRRMIIRTEDVRYPRRSLGQQGQQQPRVETTRQAKTQLLSIGSTWPEQCPDRALESPSTMIIPETGRRPRGLRHLNGPA